MYDTNVFTGGRRGGIVRHGRPEMLQLILTIVIGSALAFGWFTYDMFVNFWDYFLEVPWFIKVLGILVFLGSFSGGLRRYDN